jgi:hypothetical protein
VIEIAPSFFFALSIERQIGDERCVPVDERNDRIGEVEPELGGDDAELAGLEIPLDRLLQLRSRLEEERELEADDRVLLSILVRLEMMTRMETT